MKKQDFLTQSQYVAICLVALLSPIIRVIPSQTAEIVGRGAWLSPLLGLPMLLLYLRLLRRVQRDCAPGEGLAEAILKKLGAGPGKAVLLLFVLWLSLYAGFTARSGAERFVSTIYPESTPGFFVAALLALAFSAAAGSLRALGRFSELFRVIFLAALFLVVLFAVPGADWRELLPVSAELPRLLYGALPTVNIAGAVVYFNFLRGSVRRLPQESPHSAGHLCGGVLLVSLLIAAILATFGPELTVKISLPFFTLAQNLRLIGSFARIGAIVVALWVVSDFVMMAVLQKITVFLLQKLLGERKKKLCYILSCTLVAGFSTIFSFSGIQLERWSALRIPLANLVVVFGIVPVIYILGEAKKLKFFRKNA